MTTFCFGLALEEDVSSAEITCGDMILVVEFPAVTVANITKERNIKQISGKLFINQ